MEINTQDKQLIKSISNTFIKKQNKINIKVISKILREKYALFEIKRYITNELKIKEDNIKGEKCKYFYKKNGYYCLSGGDGFNGVYMHQYIVSRKLGIPLRKIKKYIIHHIDGNRVNNNITNLQIFLNRELHVLYHKSLKYYPDMEVKEFINDYIENLREYPEIQYFVMLCDLLQKKQKTKKDLSRCKDKWIEKYYNNENYNILVGINQ